jgi:aminocarboxymuconate-semialdehyde decarboxylase
MRSLQIRPMRMQMSRCMSTTAAVAVDVHTHMYLPKYMEILTKRTEVPYVRRVEGIDRLVILPGEDKEKSTSIGRPIGREYFDVSAKLQFMDNHGINKSVISLANPWLDFLTGHAAESVAQELNDELQSICENAKGRLYGFATLPVRNGKASLKELERLASLSYIKVLQILSRFFIFPNSVRKGSNSRNSWSRRWLGS